MQEKLENNFSNVLDLRNLQEQVEKIVLTLHYSNELFKLISKFLQILSLQHQKHQKKFSHSRSEQFWKQNTYQGFQFFLIF